MNETLEQLYAYASANSPTVAGAWNEGTLTSRPAVDGIYVTRSGTMYELSRTGDSSGQTSVARNGEPWIVADTVVVANAGVGTYLVGVGQLSGGTVRGVVPFLTTRLVEHP